MIRRGFWNIWSKPRVSILPVLISHIDTTPNVDYFTKEELRDLVRGFKEVMASSGGGLDEVSITSHLLHIPCFTVTEFIST